MLFVDVSALTSTSDNISGVVEHQVQVQNTFSMLNYESSSFELRFYKFPSFCCLRSLLLNTFQ